MQALSLSVSVRIASLAYERTDTRTPRNGMTQFGRSLRALSIDILSPTRRKPQRIEAQLLDDLAGMWRAVHTRRGVF